MSSRAAQSHTQVSDDHIFALNRSSHLWIFVDCCVPFAVREMPIWDPCPLLTHGLRLSDKKVSLNEEAEILLNFLEVGESWGMTVFTSRKFTFFFIQEYPPPPGHSSFVQGCQVQRNKMAKFVQKQLQKGQFLKKWKKAKNENLLKSTSNLTKRG